MASLSAITKDIARSLGSMLAVDRSEADMQNLSEAHGKPLKKSDDALIKPTGDPHKITNLVNDISDILKKDKSNEDVKDSKIKKKSQHIKSKDYLTEKKYKIPSAAELMNGPLRDSYHGLESGTNTRTKASNHDLSNLTAKDLSKSVTDNLNMAFNEKESQARKGRRGSLDVKKSSAHIINSKLASTTEVVEPRVRSKDSLRITGNDLIKSSKTSFDDVSKRNKKMNSKGSIAHALNEPFRESKEALGLRSERVDKTVKIRAPDDTDVYVATKEQHNKHKHEKI